MNYDVVIGPDALLEIEEAYQWMLQKHPEWAHRWFDGLEQARDSLARFPERCPLAPENEHFAEEIRQLLYGKGRGQYRILFTIHEDTVYILHVRHAARPHLEPEVDNNN